MWAEARSAFVTLQASINVCLYIEATSEVCKNSAALRTARVGFSRREYYPVQKPCEQSRCKVCSCKLVCVSLMRRSPNLGGLA
jgi:hypothetical protein